MSARVLAVDDSSSMRQMVRAALEAEGLDVLEAANGREALDVLGADPVDLVITDLYMPGMDGLALVQAIRQQAEHRFTPILVLTTEHADEFKQRGRVAGATGWLVKPFRPEQLGQVVMRVLGAVRVRV